MNDLVRGKRSFPADWAFHGRFSLGSFVLVRGGSRILIERYSGNRASINLLDKQATCIHVSKR